MRGSIAFIVLAVGLAACGQQNASKGVSQTAHLDAPAPDTDPARNFNAGQR